MGWLATDSGLFTPYLQHKLQRIQKIRASLVYRLSLRGYAGHLGYIGYKSSLFGRLEYGSKMIG